MKKCLCIRKSLFFLAISLLLLYSCSKGSSSGNKDNQKFVFKYSNTQSENHPRSKSMVFFRNEIEKRTDGQITVELFFNGILGKESDVLDLVKNGTIQGCRGGLFERANKKYIIYTLPFIFDNPEQMLKAAESSFGQKINSYALENSYYIPVCGIAGGLRNITNNIRPINTPDDLKGLKIRTPPIDLTIITFNELGAIPREIAYTETYLALEKNVADGQENPLSNIVDMKFYEVQKYLSLVNWQAHPDPFFINPDWYESLPDNLKLVFNETAEEMMEYSNRTWLESENDFLTFLKDRMLINDVDSKGLEQFKEAVKPVWQYYIDKDYFSWEDINTVLEIISEE